MVVKTVANNLQCSYHLIILLYMSANTPQDEGAFERNLIYKSYTNKINWLGCWKPYRSMPILWGEYTTALRFLIFRQILMIMI